MIVVAANRQAFEIIDSPLAVDSNIWKIETNHAMFGASDMNICPKVKAAR